jgi:hypothetical protein
MTKIFESPDKGKTVYEREFGAPYTERKLVKEWSESHEQALEAIKGFEWQDGELVNTRYVETKKPITNNREIESANEFESARNNSKTWSMEQD